jgi:hypothetical protein
MSTSVTFSDDVDIDLTAIGVSIKMQIYNRNQLVLNVSNGNGITIVSARVFEIDKIEKENNNMPVGVSLGDLEITDGDGDRFTYFNVEYTITKQYTR